MYSAGAVTLFMIQCSICVSICLTISAAEEQNSNLQMTASLVIMLVHAFRAALMNEPHWVVYSLLRGFQSSQRLGTGAQSPHVCALWADHAAPAGIAGRTAHGIALHSSKAALQRVRCTDTSQPPTPQSNARRGLSALQNVAEHLLPLQRVQDWQRLAL